MQKQYKKVKLDKIRPYKNNPRINDDAVPAIEESIKQVGYINPIVVDENYEVLAGHTRLSALKEMGAKEAEILQVGGLSEEQKRKYRVLDNKTSEFADWDFELLEQEIEGLDFGDFDFDFDIDFEEDKKQNIYSKYAEGEKGSLGAKFVMPPFSVLDTRKGEWQARKKEWLQITGNLSETRDGDFGVIGGRQNEMMSTVNDGTSNFDPVLAEIMYKWFCIDNGNILDPFAGEQTKGVVAGECGYGYTAVEIRKQQVDVNKQATKHYKNINYVCGDSNNISELIKERNFDMCFTSPPYYDLEIYSKEDLSALGTYEEFMEQYTNIFKQCYDMLDVNTFCVVKVGEIRDGKTGEYRNFVADTVNALRGIGFKYYNEIVMIQSAGTLPLRVQNSMRTRKVGKMHQNVLVFYKGDTKKIKDKFKTIDFGEVEDGDVEDSSEEV